MKAKLIKKEDGYVLGIKDKIGTMLIATNSQEQQRISEKTGSYCQYQLSLKNCQAIENDYDLDELTEDYYDSLSDTLLFVDAELKYSKKDFKEGFQKALEILGDKKFSEEQMLQAFLKGVSLQIDAPTFQQSLQQTEWDVEIVMEEVSIGDKYTPEPKPKLDVDGCLILKRK